MTITNNNTIAKVAAVVAGLGLVAMSFASFAPANAQTTADLNAQIQTLLAQIASLQAQMGGTTTMSTTFTRDLTVGSTGADVTSLQTWLISKGYAIPAGATGYFGAQTQAALAAYQAANGITPAAGYFGPITRAKVNASAGTTTTTGTGTTTTTTTTLKGGEADLTNFDLTTGDGDVNANQEGAELANAKFDVDNGDISVQRVEADFTLGGVSGSASDKPWQYFDEVSVMADGKTLGHVDASDRDAWDEQDDGTYRITISGLNYVVKEGDRAELTIAADVSDLNTDEADANVDVTVPEDGIRAVDAAGIQQYIGDDNDSVNVSFDTEENGDLSIRKNGDNPEEGTLLADDSDTSDDLTVLGFTIKNDADADTDLNEITVDVATSTSGTGGLDDIINRATLTIDGHDYDGDVNNDLTITFDDLDETVDANDSVDATVTIRLSQEGTAYHAGDTLTFSITGNATDIDAEGSDSGDELTDSDISGTVSSDTQTISLTDVSVDPTSTTSDVNDDEDLGTYSIDFKVTAGDDVIYVPQGAGTTTAASHGAIFSLSNDPGTGSDVDADLTSNADTETDSGITYYVVEPGTSENFTLSVSVDPATSNFYQVTLESVRYGDEDFTSPTLQTLPVDTNDEDAQTASRHVNAS